MKTTQAVQIKKLVLTVLGGSQGAGVLGDLVPDAIAMIDKPLRSKMKHQSTSPHRTDRSVESAL